MLEQRLRLQNVGLRRLLGGGQFIDGRLRHVLVFHQRLGALQLQICVDLRRLGLGEIGRLLIDCRFVGVRLDAKKQIAGLDHLPFGEIALADKAGHARHDIHLVESGDAANKIAGLRHLPAHDRLYRDRGRRCALRQTATATKYRRNE